MLVHSYACYQGVTREMPTVITGPQDEQMGGVIFGYPAKDIAQDSIGDGDATS